MLKETIIYLPAGALTIATAISGMTLAGAGGFAEPASRMASATVPASCTLTANETSHAETITNGAAKEIAGAAITTKCNNTNGYSVYATGWDSENEEAKTTLGTGTGAIATGTVYSGADSAWGFKVAASGVAAPTVQGSYANYSAVPGSSDKIAVGAAGSGTLTASYKVWVSDTQAAGSYSGSVKYTIVGTSSEN